MKTLKQKIEKIAVEYIKQFEKKYGLQLEHAVPNDFLGILCFGDYFINFNDVKYCIDNDYDVDLFFKWYDDNLEYNTGKECDETFYINLEQYKLGKRHKLSKK